MSQSMLSPRPAPYFDISWVVLRVVPENAQSMLSPRAAPYLDLSWVVLRVVPENVSNYALA